jgi:hypothetical protein
VTLTFEPGVHVVEVFPSRTEVAIACVPQGGVAVVHHRSGVREYTYSLPDVPMFLVAPGDREAIGWGWSEGWYGSLRGVRNGHHRLDRQAWHDAAAAVQRGASVTYVIYEQVEYFGKPRWTAVGAREGGVRRG